MPLKVGELYATLKMDTKDFEKGLDQAKSRLSSFGSVLGAGVQATATMFTATTTSLAALGVAAYKVGADYNKLQQNSRAALTTLLGSAEAANAQMEKLDDFARNSPFAKQVFITAQQQLLGFGVAAENVIPILDAVQNAVASVSGSNEQVSQITYALAQMQGQGKLTGETLNQLGQYGIDAATILGEKMGVTGAQIRDMASKPGGIPVAQVWDPLVDGLMEKFGGATANIKKQMDGATDRVKGAWRDIGSIIAKPFIDPNGGGRAVDWTNAFADALRALEQKVGPLDDILVKRFTPALDSVIPLLDKGRSAINSWDLSKVNGQLDTLGRYAPLVAGTATALFALGSNGLVLGRLGMSLNPVVAGIAALVAASPELRAALGQALTAFEPLIPIAGELGKLLVDELMEAIVALAPAIVSLGDIAGNLTVAFATALTPALSGVIGMLTPTVKIFADMVKWVSELPGPILYTVAAFAALKALGMAQILGGIGTVFGGLLTQVKAKSENAALGTRMLALRAGEAKLAFEGLGTSMKAAFISNPIGLALTAITVGIGLFTASQEKARQKTEEHRQKLQELSQSFDQTTGAISEATRELVYNDFIQNDDLVKAAERAGLAMRDLVDMALDPANEKLQGLSASNAIANQGWIDSANALSNMNGVLGETQIGVQGNAEYNSALSTVLNEVGIKAGEVSSEQDKLRAKIEATTTAVRDNTEANLENAGIVLSAREANTRYAEQMLNATDKITKNNQALADGTLSAEEHARAMLDNESTLDSTARAALGMVEANRRNNETTEQLQARLQSAREDFIKLAIETGKTAEEANNLANQVGLIPKNVTASIKLNDQITPSLQTISQKLLAIGSMKVKPTVQINGNAVVDFAAYGRARADGGIDDYGRTVARVPQILGGGRNVLWAEPETGWEAYISGKTSAKARNLQVLDEAARRLGRFVVDKPSKAFADGGFNNVGASVPVDPSGLLMGLLDRLERAVVSRPVTLQVDGRVFAEVSADVERRFKNR